MNQMEDSYIIVLVVLGILLFIAAFGFIFFSLNKETPSVVEKQKMIDEAKRLYQKGEKLCDEEKWDKAADCFRQSINYDNTSSANMRLGHCLLEMGQMQSAEHFLKIAVELDKNESLNYSMLALLYRRKRNYTEELKCLKMSTHILEFIEIPELKSKVDNPIIGGLNKEGVNQFTYYLAVYTSDIGVCLLNISKRNRSLAKEYFIKSNKIVENVYATRCLATMYFEDKDYVNATKYARETLNFTPNDYVAKNLLNKSIRYLNNPPVPIFEILRKFIRKTSPFIYIFPIVSLFLLIGVFVDSYNLSDGYYMLLRVITCATCVYSAVKFKTEWTRWIFGVFAVLYNPVLPVHLGDKDLWSIINLATIIYMWVALFAERRATKAKNGL